MKAKDTLFINSTITLNLILARRAWFWHVASHIYVDEGYPVQDIGSPTHTHTYTHIHVYTLHLLL